MSDAKAKHKATDVNATARAAVERSTTDAIVALFLVRDGLVLPDELASPDNFSEAENQRALVVYAELRGLLKAGVAAEAHRRLTAEE